MDENQTSMHTFFKPVAKPAAVKLGAKKNKAGTSSNDASNVGSSKSAATTQFIPQGSGSANCPIVIDDTPRVSVYFLPPLPGHDNYVVVIRVPFETGKRYSQPETSFALAYMRMAGCSVRSGTLRLRKEFPSVFGGLHEKSLRRWLEATDPKRKAKKLKTDGKDEAEIVDLVAPEKTAAHDKGVIDVTTHDKRRGRSFCLLIECFLFPLLIWSLSQGDHVLWMVWFSTPSRLGYWNLPRPALL